MAEDAIKIMLCFISTSVPSPLTYCLRTFCGYRICSSSHTNASYCFLFKHVSQILEPIMKGSYTVQHEFKIWMDNQTGTRREDILIPRKLSEMILCCFKSHLLVIVINLSIKLFVNTTCLTS